MISAGHSNRKAYNWLIYNINDDFLLKLSNNYKGRLFDLGAGEGVYKEFFLRYATDYIAVDWSSSYHNTKADIIADLNKSLPIESASADTVVSISVLEHLCEPQVMIDESFRILRPGGNIILQVPWQWWIHEAPHDYFRFTPYGLKYIFSKSGFDQIEIYPLAGYFTTAILKFNYFTNRFVGGPRVLRWLMRLLFIPIWYLGQKIASVLDGLDKNRERESPGFFVIARKP